MKQAVLVVAIVVSTAGAASGQISGNQGYNAFDVQTLQRIREMNPRLVRARTLVANREFERAKKELSLILAKAPEISEAHFLMAKVHYAGRDFGAALDAMERAEKTFEALSGLMTEMKEDRRSDLLKRRAEAEITVNEVRASPNLNRSAALQARLNRAEQLRSDIDRELNNAQTGATAPPAEYAFFHGNILLRLQKYTEAVAEYEQALTADPQYADAANNLASLYYSAKQYPKALEVLNRVEAKGATVNPELKKAIQEAMPK